MGKFDFMRFPPHAVDHPIREKDRHSFGAPLKIQKAHPFDLVYSAALPILQEYNEQNFHHAADPLLIEALSISPTLFYGYDTTSAVHLLVRSGTFIKVQLKLVCDLDAGWEAGTVVVRDDERWISLREWLRTLPQSSMRNIDKAALEVQ